MRNHLVSLITLAAVALIGFSSSRTEAETLALYTFATGPIPTATVPGLIAGNATNGGLAAFRPRDTANSGNAFGLPVLNVQISGYPGLANALTASSYFAFTVAADTGNRFLATNLTFNAASRTSGRGWALYSSLDNFTGLIASNGFPTDSPTFTSFNVPLSGLFTNALTNVTFRLYVWAEGVNKQANFNNFAVGGSVTCRLPPAPRGLLASPNSGPVTLTWNSSPAAVGYSVKRSLTPSGPYTKIASGVSATTFLDASALSGAVHYYVVSGLNAFGEGPDSLPASALPANFLKASRCDLRDHAGTGSPQYLRGVNLGGWLYFEGWMCPGVVSGITNGNPLQPDVETNLLARFGVTTKDSLVETYQSAWITQPDLDLVAAAGMNLVRVPITYSVFQEQPYDPAVPLNQIAWKPDAVAFKHLDWLVNECARRRIYVVFDFHNPEGGASATGLYGYPGYQDRFVEIWRRVAAHYVGNPTVLGYDLVNESGSASNLNAVWDRAYQAIRAVDPDHAIVAEYWSIAGTTQVMDAYGWQNVIASMHDYWTNGATVYNELIAARASPTPMTVCPYFVGEFMENTSSPQRLQYYSDAGALWCSWTLKSVNQQSWSLLNAIDNGPNSSTDTPNLSTNTAAEINARWAKWSTRPPLVRYQPQSDRLASPVAVNDQFQVATNAPVAFTAQSLLTNDTDLSLLCQLTVTNAPARTAHGTLTVTTNGFLYQPDAGFIGTDSFGYTPVDQRLHLPAAYNGTVFLNVMVPGFPALKALPGVRQINLAWTSAPGAAAYLVKRALTSGGPYRTIVGGVSGTNFTDNSVSQGITYFYVVTATNTFGESLPSPEVAAAPADTVIYPAADATVRAGAYANSNFGTTATLDLKLDANADYWREAYLRFNVTGLTNATSARLSLTPTVVGNPAVNLNCEFVADDTWSETAVTWNTKPAGSSTYLADASGFAAGIPILLDLTSAITNAAAADGQLCLRLTLATPSVNLSFGAHELSDPLYRPQLLITTAPVPLMLSAQLITNVLVLSWPACYTSIEVLAQTNSMTSVWSNDWLVLSSAPTGNSLSVPANTAKAGFFYRLRLR